AFEAVTPASSRTRFDGASGSGSRLLPFSAVAVHAAQELVEHAANVLLVLVSLLAACLEHLAEDVVVGIALPALRLVWLGPRRLPRLLLSGLLPAAQHVLQDLAPGIVAGRV